MFSDDSLNIYNKKKQSKIFLLQNTISYLKSSATKTGQKLPQKKCVHTEEPGVAACERLEKDVKSDAGYKNLALKSKSVYYSLIQYDPRPCDVL